MPLLMLSTVPSSGSPPPIPPLRETSRYPQAATRYSPMLRPQSTILRQYAPKTPAGLFVD
ncbi:hypothetical protein, partial [Azotobacter vinelandii]